MYCDYAYCTERGCTEPEHYRSAHVCNCGWCTDCAANGPLASVTAGPHW